MDDRNGHNVRYDSANPYTAYANYEGLHMPPPRKVQTEVRDEHYRPRHYYDSDDSEDDDHSDSDRHRGRRSRSIDERAPVRRSRSVGYSKPKRERSPRKSTRDPRPPEDYTIAKALKGAAMAASVEAFRCRMEPGPWKGQKGARVATAAVSGALIGTLRNGRLRKDGKLPIAEAAMTGIYAVDFLKRVLRQTEHENGAEEERKKYTAIEDDEEDDRRESRRHKSRSRASSPSVRSRSTRRKTVEYR